MFHKEKFKADGQLDKDKCQLVTIGETLCATVNPLSVMTQLNLAAVISGTVISDCISFSEYANGAREKNVHQGESRCGKVLDSAASEA
jgi:hypothetical protein